MTRASAEAAAPLSQEPPHEASRVEGQARLQEPFGCGRARLAGAQSEHHVHRLNAETRELMPLAHCWVEARCQPHRFTSIC